MGQYHTLPNSEDLARELLKIQDVYPPAKQLGTDMLLILDKWTSICNTMIAEGKVGLALMLFVDKWKPTPSAPKADTPTPGSFIRAALKLGDRKLVYDVYTFFSYQPQFQQEIRQYKKQVEAVLQSQSNLKMEV